MAELVDRARMRETAEACGWTFAELAARYLAEAAKERTSVEEALAGGDAAEVARLAHGWAGASETAGVVGMGPVLREVEQAARAERLADAARLFEQVERLLAGVREELA